MGELIFGNLRNDKNSRPCDFGETLVVGQTWTNQQHPITFQTWHCEFCDIWYAIYMTYCICSFKSIHMFTNHPSISFLFCRKKNTSNDAIPSSTPVAAPEKISRAWGQAATSQARKMLLQATRSGAKGYSLGCDSESSWGSIKNHQLTYIL